MSPFRPWPSQREAVPRGLQGPHLPPGPAPNHGHALTPVQIHGLALAPGHYPPVLVLALDRSLRLHLLLAASALVVAVLLLRGRGNGFFFSSLPYFCFIAFVLYVYNLCLSVWLLGNWILGCEGTMTFF